MQSKATCARDISTHKAQTRRLAWSPAGLAPALAAAVQLLQQQQHLAAVPAALSSRASHCGQMQPHQLSQQAQWCGPCSTSDSSHKQQQHAIQSLAWLVCCTADSAPASTGQAADPAVAGTPVSAAADNHAHPPAAVAPAGQQAADAASMPRDPAAAAAALARLQQAMQRQPAQPPSTHHSHKQASQPQQFAATSTVSSSSVRRLGQQFVQPQRPVMDAAAAAAAQEALQQQQQPRRERLLAWRSHGKGSAAAAAAVQEQLDQQEQQARQQTNTGTDSVQPQQQQQQLPAPPLEPSMVGGRAYVTSPVSVVAAGTLTRRLAGSITAAFAVHQHQLMFAAGPHPLGVAVKALATARRMLGEGEGGVPVNILMQPTLRGGRTPMRCQSYALDITRVGALKMQPGVAGRQAVTPSAESSSSSSSSSSAESAATISGDGKEQQQQAVPWADAKVVHITSSSNEIAAARSLVENMPARGQTVMRAMGPYATETAVLALALARPLMQARHGQDLVAVVLWNEQQQQRTYRPGRETGLLLAVFRCEVGSFPPRVLLLPPSRRNSKRQEFWQQRGRRTATALPQQQQ